jgi:hypothetical protein
LPYWDPDIAFARVFLNRHAGTQIGWTLLVQQGDGAFPYAGPLEVCKAALARRFGVSLMHVKRLFAQARREGLIRQDDGHQLFLTEIARDQIRFLYGGQLVQLLKASARTLALMAPLSNCARFQLLRSLGNEAGEDKMDKCVDSRSAEIVRTNRRAFEYRMIIGP